MNEDRIEHTEGGTSFVGPRAVDVYVATVLASGLRLYAKTGIKPGRSWTPKNMMAKAAEITGLTFKARAYNEAADALTATAIAGAEAINGPVQPVA